LTPNVCALTPTTTGYSLTTVAGIVGNGNICTIEATQPGDDRWAAATPVIRTITYNKAGMSVRLNRLSTIIVGKASELFVVENRFCSVSNIGPLQTTAGVHTQFTVTGVANGSCSVTFGYAGSDTRNSAYRTQAITVTGVK
jgi:hypothetical protein